MKTKTNEMTVGIFVIVGFILLTFVLFFVSGVYLVRAGYKINVMYSYVSILDKGAPVRMAGVRVGEVNKVDLIYDESKRVNRVRVKLFIEKGVEIRENYTFTIRGTHVLSEPHIEITPVPGDFPLLHRGATVEGTNLVPVEALIDRAHEIMSQLAGIMKKFNTEVVDGGTIKDLKVMVANLSDLSGSLSQALKGSEEDLHKSLQNIDQSTASLSTILSKTEKGEGTLGQLLMKDDLYQELDAFVKDIRAHPWKLLKKDKGASRKWYFLFLA